MAGRVADRACRFFTRRFGETLLEGESLIAAAAQGRWGAFAEGYAPEDSADWGFPALFLAERVEQEFIPVPLQSDDPALEIEKRVKHYGVLRQPVFCGREEFFDAYYRLMAPNAEKAVVAFSTDHELPQLGRTRLLQELTIQALRDGHIPCLIASDEKDWDPGIKNKFQFGIELLRAIAWARQGFGLRAPLRSHLLSLLHREVPMPGQQAPEAIADNYPALSPDEYVEFDTLIGRYKRNLKRKQEDDGVRGALAADLAQLQEDARAGGSSGRVLVLLDDAHKFGKVISELFAGVPKGLLGDFGLGTGTAPVPVILAYSRGTVADSSFPNQERLRPSWLESMTLGPFHRDDGEDELAWQQFLLHPTPQPGRPAPPQKNDPTPAGMSAYAWAINDDFDGKGAKWQRVFRGVLDGQPVRLYDKSIFAVAGGAWEDDYLVLADDEALLKAMRGLSWRLR